MQKFALYGLGTLFAGLFSFQLCAKELPDLSKFQPMSKTSDGPVFIETFNSGMNGWSNPSKCFQWCRTEGIMGTGCAMAEQTDQDVYAQKEVKLEHGVFYRLKVHYRSEMVEDPVRPDQEIFCIRFRDSKTGKVNHGSYIARRESSVPQWTEWVHTFRIPDGYDSTVILELLIRTERIGKVWFDDISIEPAEAVKPMLFPLQNSVMTYNPDAGITYFLEIPQGRKESDFRLLVEAGGVKKLLVPQNGKANGKFGEFPKGKLAVKATLLDMANKKITGIDESALYVRDVENIPGRIIMEADGRMLRDGKPFLPVGVYCEYKEDDDTQVLQRIREAGFNSVEMVWQWIDFAGRKENKREQLIAGVRKMAEYDLTYLCAIKYQLPGAAGRCEKLDDVEGVENVTRYIVESIKREPNVLGYYISDENPVTEIPEILRLRHTISELDPWHPTLSLTCRADDFRMFAQTGDYIMYDCYPVGDHIHKDSPEQSMSEAHNAIKRIGKVGTPFVWVPQIMCWNSATALLPERYPTADEMCAMALLGAIYDAKAYYFYAYHFMFYGSPTSAPKNTEEQWKNVTVVGKLITSLSPYFLSREAAPAVTVKQLSGAPVAARAFVHEGKTLVVITADGPNACEAEITVPGCTGLKSRNGKTEEIAPGVYKFKGMHIDFDLLSSAN